MNQAPDRLRRMFKNRFKWFAPLGAVVLISFTSLPIQAAERIVFRFGELERSVRVDDLASFLSTGTVSESISFIIDPLSQQDRHALQFALGHAFPVSSLEVSDFLQTAMGGVVVRQFAKLAERPQSEAVPALSSALILGASAGQGLRLIDVLQQYPLENLIVSVPKVMKLARRLRDQFELEGEIFPRLGAQGPARRLASTPLEDLALDGKSPYRRERFSFLGQDGNTITAVALVPIRSSPPAGSAQLPRPPLIVLAPGLNTDINALLYVGEHLASHGYGVAALDFPFTSANRVAAAIKGLATIPPPNAWYHQPIDVSRLIDQVGRRWPGQINTGRVGALGQSLGGYTVLALGGARLDWPHLESACAVLNDPAEVEFNPAILWQCQAPGAVVKASNFSDPRIKAVIAVNPVSNPIFSKTSMQAMTTPVLIVSGTKDIFAPPISQQLIPYSSVSTSGSVLAVFDGATHLSFLDGAGRLPAWLIGPDLPVARNELKALSLAFFDQHLLGRDTLRSLLPSKAALHRAGQPMQFLLRRTLPPRQLQGIDPSLSPSRR